MLERRRQDLPDSINRLQNNKLCWGNKSNCAYRFLCTGHFHGSTERCDWLIVSQQHSVLSTYVKIRPKMAEKGDKNDRKLACFWDDFENVLLTPPRHVGSETSPSLKAGLKRVPSVAILSKNTAETAKERVQTCSTPRDGVPRHAGGGQFNAWLPAWFCPRGVFRRGWRTLNSQFGAARRQVRRFPKRLSRSGPPVTHRDGISRVRPRATGRAPTPAEGTLPRSSPRGSVAWACFAEGSVS